MAEPTFIAGPYYAKWGGNYIGKTMEGFSQTDTIHSHDIKTDDFGGMAGALVDAVILGKSTIVELDYAEYTAIAHAINARKPGADALFAAAGGHADAGRANAMMGMLASALAKPLVLTRMSAATTAEPAKRTFLRAIVMGGIPTLIKAGLRNGPVRFICLPDARISATYSPGSWSEGGGFSGGGSVQPSSTYGLVWQDD